ncbi:hypothetical protein BUALT_Bualt13G0116200 [Buddleja alternifolia]|uniref:Uncharacterized protein n=1 Tax=Buddleja alternifolia TaxID=168488 RepID=A0AAV6WU13_9LAMI|nr:hypothetical protein BUALT_Bualt13G0116200 [Buddleja alternifolia]
MSRCFPFPPPGYEKRATPDDVNLIIKEKHKQKKHKDKKDKDKKERSEKKEKERSEGKDKRDKERKEKKHRDKKDKKEEKQRSLEERKTEASSENQNVEKLGSGSKPNDQIQDCRILSELGKRVRNGSGATGSQMVQKNNFPEPKNEFVGNFSSKNPNIVEGGSRQVHTDSQMVQKNILVGQKNGLVGNFSREKPNKVEDGSFQVHANSQMVQKNILMGQKNGLVGNLSRENRNKVEGGSRQVHVDSPMVQKNILVGQKNGFIGNISRENPNKVEHVSGQVHAHSQMVHKSILVGQKNGFVRNISGENKNMVEGGSHRTDEDEKGKEGEKENKKRKSSDSKGDGHKIKDRDKSSKAEEKKRKKEKKEKKEKKKQEEIKRRESGGSFPDFCKNKPLDLLKESCDSLENLPKRKELPLNVFLHDNGIQPNIMSRPASSSQAGQNGSGFDPCQNNINLAVEKGGVIINHKVNGKVSSSQSVIKNVMNMEPSRSANNFTAEHGRHVISTHTVSNEPASSHLVGIEKKIEPNQTASNVAKVDKVPSPCPVFENGRRLARPVIDKAAEWRGPDTKNGVVEDKPCTSSRASSVKAKEKKIDTHKKPPHPDSKFLSEIYSVPPQIEWSQFDDQEWLFGFEGSRAKRAKVAPSEIDPSKQVWAEAMQVESADVIALPYVIPY